MLHFNIFSLKLCVKYWKKKKTSENYALSSWTNYFFNQSVCVCACWCVNQSEPWSGPNLLDWDVEVIQPTTFPALKVGGLGYSRGLLKTRIAFGVTLQGVMESSSFSLWNIVHENNIGVKLCDWGHNVNVCSCEEMNWGTSLVLLLLHGVHVHAHTSLPLHANPNLSLP